MGGGGVTPEQVRAVRDPAERLEVAQGFLERGEEALRTVRRVRDEAIVELLVAEWSHRKVAAQAGCSRGYVAQVARAAGLVSTRRAVLPRT